MISIFLGLVFIAEASYLLFYRLDKDCENRKIAVSQAGLKVISWLVIGGIFLTFLGCMNLMGIISRG